MEKVNPVRVLVAAPLYPPQIGGPATHALLIEGELPKRGFVIRVLPFSRVLFLPKVVRHVLYFLLLIRQGIGAQVIYALDPVSVGFPACLAAQILGKRFVLRVGGDYAWEQGVERFGVTDMLDDFLVRQNLPLRVRRLQKIQSYVARHAARVIAPSEYLQGVISQWGISKEKITVAHSVPSSTTSISRNAARAHVGVGEDVFVFVSAGRLVPWKGFSTLITTASGVLHNPQALLAIAGDGPQKETLEDVIEKNGLHESVRLLGALTKSELTYWLAAADVFVLNTGYEGFSHQILEAMQMGLPVLTTSVGGNKELIENNVSGIAVPYNDAHALSEGMTRLREDVSLRRRIAETGKRRAAEFKESDSLTAIAHALTI